jgi:hypothetical protein
MWPFLEKLLSRSTTLNMMMGNVVFTTPRERGAFAHSFFEWRVKASIDGSQVSIGLAMKADSYAGVEGSPTNYMQFDVDTAIRLRDNLNACIEFVRQQSNASA